MQYTIEELKQCLFSKVYAVYDVFKDYFGEAYVDLQGLPSDTQLREVYYSNQLQSDGSFSFTYTPSISLPEDPFILVWWPSVTVTNEYDKSVTIDDLYAKISLTLLGCICNNFRLNRSTYSLLQYQSDYMHSHVNGIPSDPEYFTSPCLGRGPINRTIAFLHSTFDTTMWMLFCNELAAYVTVESVSGTPYRYLERIGGTSSNKQGFTVNTNYAEVLKKFVRAFCGDCPYLPSELVQNFALYYLKNGHLKFNFSDGAFSIGMSFYNFIIDISNSFIAWFNSLPSPKVSVSHLFDWGVIKKKIISNGTIYDTFSSHNSSLNNVGKHVIFFKGQDIKLRVYATHTDNTNNTAIILSTDIACAFLQCILTILNFRFKKHANTSSNTAPSREEYSQCSSSPCANVRYL